MVAAGTCECAQRYYQKLVQGIQKNDLSKWENEIKNAEEIRLQDRSAMDILGAKVLIHVPAAAGEVEENGNSASDVDWIQLALTIEEKQFVFYYFLLLFANVILSLSGLKFEIVYAGPL